MQIQDYFLTCRVWLFKDYDIRPINYYEPTLILFNLLDIPKVSIKGFRFIEILNKHFQLCTISNVSYPTNEKTHLQILMNGIALQKTKFVYKDSLSLDEVLKNLLSQKLKEYPYSCYWINKLL